MLAKGTITELQSSQADKGFYSTLFLVPKKDGGLKASNKPTAPERVYPSPSLEDGGNAHLERYPENGRLHG